MNIKEIVEETVKDVCKEFNSYEEYRQFMTKTHFEDMVFNAHMDYEHIKASFERNAGNDITIYNDLRELESWVINDDDVIMCNTAEYHITRSMLMYIYYRLLAKMTVRFQITLDNL